MREIKGRTPAEIFRSELADPPPDALQIAAVTIDGRDAVRFKMGGTTIYHWPEDAKRIAAAIIECAEHGRKK